MDFLGPLFILIHLVTLARSVRNNGECWLTEKYENVGKGYALIGHVISSFQVPDRFECSFACLQELRCWSYNFHEVPGPLHLCQLSDKNRESEPGDYQVQANMTYYDSDKPQEGPGCLSSPCQKSAKCVGTCHRPPFSFRCVCDKYHEGNTCQNWSVLFCGCDAALPAVGRCSVMDYYCDARKCNTAFVKGLQKDPSADCGIKYLSLTSCVKKPMTYCAGHILPESEIDDAIKQSFKKYALCMEGNLFVPPTPQPGVTTLCTSDFHQKSVNCSKSFHAKFQANRSDSLLCSEFAKGKKCLKDVIASECKMPASAQELLDLMLSDYNPYCDNNRDPEATGNDQCYGVSTLTPPIDGPDTSATSGSTASGEAQPSGTSGLLKSAAISTGGRINLTALFICALLMRFF